MKITPFILFLLLLVVLVLSILFSNFLPIQHDKEGFIAFSENKQPIDYISIPQYSSSSNTVVKLYDNLFFDTLNANLIEVDGAAYVIGNTSTAGNTSTSGNTSASSTSTIDSTGISITGVYVVKRDGTSNQQPYTTVFTDATKQQVQPNNTNESQINNVNSQSTAWIYNTKSQNTDKYQVIYVSWNTNTYIHIIQVNSTPTHISSFLFGSGSVMETFVYPATQKVSAGISKDDNDTNNGKYVIDALYDPNNNVYQISHTVKFDQSNGNLIVRSQESPEQIIVYNRYGNVITDYLTHKQSGVPNTYFIPWIQSDYANNMVLYMPMASKTLIMILKLNTNTGSSISFQLGQVLRFTATGMDSDSGKASPPSMPEDNTINSDYYKWLAYWNTVVNTPYNNYSQDYLLKTQIIPPVCPSCPNCPSVAGGGTCTNCGGQGGGGTVGVSNNGTVGVSVSSSQQPGSTGQAFAQGQNATVMGQGGLLATNADANTIGGATTIQTLGVVAGTENIAKTGGDVISGTVDTAGNVIGKTVDTAGNVIGKTVDTAGNVIGKTVDTVGKTVDTAGNLIGGTVNTAGNLLQSAGSGTVGLIKDVSRGGVVTGPVGVVSDSNTYTGAGTPSGSVGGSQYTGASIGSTPIDNYSYYGALQSRGSSNYIPVTANFSAFSK
jgi:hypothetical protein